MQVTSQSTTYDFDRISPKSPPSQAFSRTTYPARIIEIYNNDNFPITVTSIRVNLNNLSVPFIPTPAPGIVISAGQTHNTEKRTLDLIVEKFSEMHGLTLSNLNGATVTVFSTEVANQTVTL